MYITSFALCYEFVEPLSYVAVLFCSFLQVQNQSYLAQLAFKMSKKVFFFIRQLLARKGQLVSCRRITTGKVLHFVSKLSRASCLVHF